MKGWSAEAELSRFKLKDKSHGWSVRCTTRTENIGSQRFRFGENILSCSVLSLECTLTVYVEDAALNEVAN